MSAYLIAHVKIIDPAGFREYEKGFFPTLKSWYHSDDDQRISQARWTNGESTMAFLRGFELPSKR